MRGRSRLRRVAALHRLLSQERAARRAAEQRAAVADQHAVQLAAGVEELHERLLDASRRIGQQQAAIEGYLVELCWARSRAERNLSAWQSARRRAAHYYAWMHAERDRSRVLAARLTRAMVLPAQRRAER